MSETNPLEAQALRCDKAADELELAVKHLRTMASHFRHQEIPRAGAHSLAVQGHLETARVVFAEIAVVHASKSRP